MGVVKAGFKARMIQDSRETSRETTGREWAKRTEPREIGDQRGYFSYPSGKAWRREFGRMDVCACKCVCVCTCVHVCVWGCSSCAAYFRLILLFPLK